MDSPLKLPPAACPNNGVCMTMEPAIEEHERELQRHSKALERIGGELSKTSGEVHEIKIMIRERDNMMGFLRTVFVSILIIGITQVGATIWFAASLNTTVVRNTGILADHESRIRSNERNESKAHPSYQP